MNNFSIYFMSIDNINLVIFLDKFDFFNIFCFDIYINGVMVLVLSVFFRYGFWWNVFDLK